MLAGGVWRVYQSENKKGTIIAVLAEGQAKMPDTLEELQALEREIEREWWWLQGALHAVAQMGAERAADVVMNFREMQEQARDVDRRRVEIAVRIAELEGWTI